MRKALYLGLVSLFAVVLFGGFINKADAAGPRVGIQAIDHGCSTQEGSPDYTTGGASGWATDTNGFNPDCYKAFLGGDVSSMDFRVGIEMGDGAGCDRRAGGVRFTPWASQGGGASGWVSQDDAFDPDCARIYIETKEVEGARISSARVGLQLSDYTCTAQFGSVEWTPWLGTKGSGGWAGYAADANAYDPDCMQVLLETDTDRIGNVSVTVTDANGSLFDGKWSLKDSDGKVVQTETAGASTKIYEKMPFGAYTIDPVSPIGGYRLIETKPSDSQTLGPVSPPACPDGQTNPHLGCSNRSCVLISGCGPENCAACERGPRPTIDPVGFLRSLNKVLDKAVSDLWDALLPKAEAIRVSNPDIPKDEDRVNEGGESYPHYACVSSACQEVNGWGVDSCSSNRECGGPSSVPPPPPAPAPAPAPTEINFSLVYKSDEIPNGVVCSTKTPTVMEGQPAQFAAVNDDPHTWSAPGGNPGTFSGSNFQTVYSSTGPKQVTVSGKSSSASCDVNVIPCTGTIKVSSNLATSWTLTGPTPQSQSPSSPAYSITYTSQQKGGPYTLIPADIDGYFWEIEDQYGNKLMDSQSITSCGGYVEFKIIYRRAGPDSPKLLSCIPGYQSVEAGKPAKFDATGKAAYSWSSAGGNPSSGSGPSYQTTYNTVGSKTVTVTADDSSTKSCTVNVTPSCPGSATLVIVPAYKAIAVGETASFSALYDEDGPSCADPAKMQNVDVTNTVQTAWSAYDETKASMSSSDKGVATGLNPGSTVIYVDYRGLTATADLDVTGQDADFSCVVNPNSIVVGQGDSVTGVVTCSPLNGFNGQITLTSDRVPPAASMTMNPFRVTVPPNASTPYTFTAGLTTVPGAYTMRVIGTSGSLFHRMNVNVTVTKKDATNLGVSLVASPSSGEEPLSSVLTANVTGSAAGTMNYSFWWNCSTYSGASVSAATAQCGAPNTAGNDNGIKFDSVSQTSKATPSHSYPTAGGYRPLVIVERGGSSAFATANVSVSKRIQPTTHAECVANACVQLSGAGPDRCTTNASCGGGGGGSDPEPQFHGACNATTKACMNVAGAGASTCGTDPACSGTAQTHLTCQSNACVIVSGAGTNENGCTSIGSSCVTDSPVGTCTFKATPGIVKRGDATTLSWTCGGGVTSCKVLSTSITGGGSGSGKVSPAQTTQYTLSCSRDTIRIPVSVYVVESYKEVPPGN
jgi:hypothetical protein